MKNQKELAKVLRAFASELNSSSGDSSSSSLHIRSNADGYEIPSFWFNISQPDSFKSRFYVTLHFYDPKNHWIEEYTTLYRARLNRIGKSDIITMMGMISGRIKPIPLKKLFPHLKPIPITTYVIAGGILFFVLRFLLFKQYKNYLKLKDKQP